MSNDKLYFYKNIDDTNVISKRYMLMIVAPVFDPLASLCHVDYCSKKLIAPVKDGMTPYCLTVLING